jgi:hypothetical protein
MSRVVQNGKTAVLISTGFGAGWSTWAQEDERELMLYDPEIVTVVLSFQSNPHVAYGVKQQNQMCQQIGLIAAVKGYQSYMGGMADLSVVWVDQGLRFKVNEYDGYESLDLLCEDDWDIA